MIDENISNRLKLLREKLGLNRAQLARSIHFVPSMVSQVEHGTVTPSPRFIAAIIHVHKVSETWLRSGRGPMFQSKTSMIDDSQLAGDGDHSVYYSVMKRYPDELQPYIDAVIEVMQSGDEVIAAALKQNLEAFREAVARGRQLGTASKKEIKDVAEK